MKVEPSPVDSRPFPLLEVRGLNKSFRGRRWPAGKAEVKAVQNIQLTLGARTTLGVVGKSGSGKTTLARCLVLLEIPDAGEIRFEGTDLLALSRSQLTRRRAQFQIVFQHSAAALNPRFSALQAVTEPLRIQALGKRAGTKRNAQEQAAAMLERVGIAAESIHRSTFEFSGGQRQRIALARALILKPKLLILDEAFSGLDLATQARMARMLLDLQGSLSLAYLFITHDLGMAARMAANIAVIEHGRIVESGSVSELFNHPRSIETRQLVEAIPTIPPCPTDFRS